MKYKFPLLYVLLLIVYVWIFGVYFMKFRGNERFLGALCGCGISFAMTVFSFYITRLSIDKSNKRFYLSVSASILFRFFVLISSIFIASTFAQIYFVSFVIALLSTYVLFLFIEMYSVYRLKLKNKNL